MSKKWNPNKRHSCGDCGVLEGQLHQRGCDMEICPFCLGKLITCDCAYEHFYPDFEPRLVHNLETEYEEALKAGFPHVHPTWGLPKEVYENGLPEEQAQKWDSMLEEKGRIPCIIIPNLCARCGMTWPDLFMAEDWKEVIPANLQREVLCYECYEIVKDILTKGRKGK